MLSELNKAREMFSTHIVHPRCVVVANCQYTDVVSITARFDFTGWAVTWLDVSQPIDASVIAVMSAILAATDLVYIVVEGSNVLVMDMGYIFGMAKSQHRPVYIDFRNDINRDDYPLCFKMADGIGCGNDDLSLFVDTFEARTELTDFATRVRAVANQIKRLRM